jgi:hypothetical protein
MSACLRACGPVRFAWHPELPRPPRQPALRPLPVCLSLCLSVCLSARLPFQLCACLPVCLAVRRSASWACGRQQQARITAVGAKITGVAGVRKKSRPGGAGRAAAPNQGMCGTVGGQGLTWGQQPGRHGCSVTATECQQFGGVAVCASPCTTLPTGLPGWDSKPLPESSCSGPGGQQQATALHDPRVCERSPPYASTAAILHLGVVVGTTMCAGMPRRDAARATAPAWLPELASGVIWSKAWSKVRLGQGPRHQRCHTAEVTPGIPVKVLKGSMLDVPVRWSMLVNPSNTTRYRKQCTRTAILHPRCERDAHTARQRPRQAGGAASWTAHPCCWACWAHDDPAIAI